MKIYKTHLVNATRNQDVPCLGVEIQTREGLARFALSANGAVMLMNELASTLAGTNYDMADAFRACCYTARGSGNTMGWVNGFAWYSESCIYGSSVWMTARENLLSYDKACSALEIA